VSVRLVSREAREAGRPATGDVVPRVVRVDGRGGTPLRIEGVKPIGNYAYGIAFSDGHNTGIYSLEFLRTPGTRIL
jgi:DUF971 family protein